MNKVTENLKSLNEDKMSLSMKVATQIEELIIERKLRVGEKLPNEFELAKQLNVGRGSIREAIKILVSRNVVEIKRGCGTFVCDKPGLVKDPLGFAFTKNRLKLALDIYEFRMIMETEMAALAAERASNEEIKEIERAAMEVEEMCEKGLDHKAKDVFLHELIAKSTKNQVMINIIPVILSGVELFISITDSTLKKETILTHRMIVDAIKERNPEKAKIAMTKHIEANIHKIKSMNE